MRHQHNMIYRLGNLVPVFGENCFIADSAEIIGDVKLSDGVSIWFNAVLRGDIAPILIGENSNIQDNSTVHLDVDVPCIVGKQVTIGHNVIIHSCTIGDNSLVGMGSTVLSHARIGKNCIVGAHSLVTSKLPYAEGCLILGSPAKIVRELTQSEINATTHNADHYRLNGLRFKQELYPIT